MIEHGNGHESLIDLMNAEAVEREEQEYQDLQSYYNENLQTNRSGVVGNQGEVKEAVREGRSNIV